MRQSLTDALTNFEAEAWEDYHHEQSTARKDDFEELPLDVLRWMTELAEAMNEEAMKGGNKA